MQTTDPQETDLLIPKDDLKSLSLEDHNAKIPAIHWVGLVLLSLAVGISLYMVETPFAIQTQLMKAPMNMNFTQYNFLMAIYYVPGIFMPFVFGLVSDRIGEYVCLPFLMGLIILGQCFFTAGPHRLTLPIFS